MKHDFKGTFTLVKLGAMNSSPYGYADRGIVGDKFRASLLENKCLHVTNMTSWYRTSPVQDSIKAKWGYQFVTENSTYALVSSGRWDEFVKATGFDGDTTISF